MKHRKIIAGISALAVSISLSGCLEDDYVDVAESVSETDAADMPDRNINVSVSDNSDEDTENSDKNIPGRSKKKAANDGTWTIFVYLCGADLESRNGMASGDIEEMLESSAGKNVRFLVQTGGASDWELDVSPKKSQRYLISDGEAELVYESDKVNMGKSSSLADFLRWGISEYPAENTGLILWDHGGGSISGVCFDEQFDDDSLLLRDIDAALYSVSDEMSAPFEFIGFDACLMATVETASVLSSHANYMIASEESEPGYGWNYTAIGDYLEENPDADGKSLGKIICDSFYSDCEYIGSENEVTLSVTDLSKIKEFIPAFDDYAKDIYDLTNDPAKFADAARAISSAENFGGNNKSSGYTNMVDLGGIISAGKEYSENSDKALELLSEAVVYKKNGKDHKNASGLSSYYPLKFDGSRELSVFKDICISPYYLGLVDKIAYGAVNDGNIESYDNSSIFSFFADTINNWSSEDYEESDGEYIYEPDDGGFWDYISDYEPTGESGAITFDVEPYIDDEENYTFTLSEDGIYNTDHIEGIVYMLTDDLEDIIELGYSGDVYGDWETGEFIDGFDGYWFSLPDDQLVAAYLMSECDGYDIYSSPILLNDEETNLVFAYYYDETEVEIIGIWDGVSDNGICSRTDTELENGDVIVPLYYSYAVNSDDEDYYYGEEYIYDSDDEMFFTELYDGEYLYAFEIDDIYGDYYVTDFINITVDGDTIYYNEY